jgi:hypothetical protein
MCRLVSGASVSLPAGIAGARGYCRVARSLVPVPPAISGVLLRCRRGLQRCLGAMCRPGSDTCYVRWPGNRRSRPDDGHVPKIVGDRVVCPNCAGEVTVAGQEWISVDGAISDAAPLLCKSCGWISRAITWRGKVERVLFSKPDTSGEPIGE